MASNNSATAVHVRGSWAKESEEGASCNAQCGPYWTEAVRREAPTEELMVGSPAVDGPQAPTVEATTGTTQSGTPKPKCKGTIGGRGAGANQNRNQGPKPATPKAPQGEWKKRANDQGARAASAVPAPTGEDSSRTSSTGTPAQGQSATVVAAAKQHHRGGRNQSDRSHPRSWVENKGGCDAPRAGRGQKGPVPCRNGPACRYLRGGCMGLHTIEDYITFHGATGTTQWGFPVGLCPCDDNCEKYHEDAPNGIDCYNRLHRGQMLQTPTGSVCASVVFDALHAGHSAHHAFPNTYNTNAAKRAAEAAEAAKAVDIAKAMSAKAQADADEARNYAAIANREADAAQFEVEAARFEVESARFEAAAAIHEATTLRAQLHQTSIQLSHTSVRLSHAEFVLAHAGMMRPVRGFRQ